MKKKQDTNQADFKAESSKCKKKNGLTAELTRL